jgi:hypothetical protein
MFVDCHAKCLVVLPDSNRQWNMSENISEYPNIKFHENPFSMSRVILHRWADGQMTISLRMSLKRVNVYEVIRYDKMNINWAGEGVVVARNLRLR